MTFSLSKHKPEAALLLCFYIADLYLNYNKQREREGRYLLCDNSFYIFPMLK